MKFTLIQLEWNRWNGLIFTICGIELGRFESELIGISWGWKSYFYIYILFIPIEIKKPWYGK